MLGWILPARADYYRASAHVTEVAQNDRGDCTPGVKLTIGTDSPAVSIVAEGVAGNAYVAFEGNGTVRARSLQAGPTSEGSIAISVRSESPGEPFTVHASWEEVFSHLAPSDRRLLQSFTPPHHYGAPPNSYRLAQVRAQQRAHRASESPLSRSKATAPLEPTGQCRLRLNAS